MLYLRFYITRGGNTTVFTFNLAKNEIVNKISVPPAILDFLDKCKNRYSVLTKSLSLFTRTVKEAVPCFVFINVKRINTSET